MTSKSTKYVCSEVLKCIYKIDHFIIVGFNQAPFEEKHRRYFDFQRRTGQLPVQKEVRFNFL